MGIIKNLKKGLMNGKSKAEADKFDSLERLRIEDTKNLDAYLHIIKVLEDMDTDATAKLLLITELDKQIRAIKIRIIETECALAKMTV